MVQVIDSKVDINLGFSMHKIINLKPRIQD